MKLNPYFFVKINICITFNGSQKFELHASSKLPKVSNHSFGKFSPNLVTLVDKFKSCPIFRPTVEQGIKNIFDEC
jgi:hypothetical protein